MAEQQNKIANGSDQQSMHQTNILQLNDDCLIGILHFLSLIEMCDLSETCKHLRNVARKAFTYKYGRKSYGIPSVRVKLFKNHSRILRNFGDLIHEVSVICFFDVELNTIQLCSAFNWLERYCGDTLRALNIVDSDKIVLPPSAVRVMAKLKQITLFAPISFKNARSMLCHCKELVELKMAIYSGPFPFAGFHFPHLKTLSFRVQINHSTNFPQMESFFEKHAQFIELETQFLTEGIHHIIDLSFLRHLVNLEKIRLIINGAHVTGVGAFTHLTKLKKLCFDQSHDVRDDIAILENLASHELVQLDLGCSEIDQFSASIGRFENLTQLTITQDMLPIFGEFDTNISCLAELQNSPLTDLKVVCHTLLEPENIVNVIRNLKKLRVMQICGQFKLTEEICKEWVTVCSSQKRKIDVILCDEIIDDMDFDFSFIEKFNEEHGQHVEIKQE